MIYLRTTGIYCDCWQSYQVRDFNDNGFILPRVNHSIWFGRGTFYTNTIEGVWSKIKRFTNNFSGLNGNVVNKLSLQGIDINDYFNDWICSAYVFMKAEHLALPENKKNNLFASI